MSLQASIPQEERRLSPNFESFSSKKRKWQQEHEESKREDVHHCIEESKLCKKEQADHIDLNLDSPLPSEWQRCLDIKSGQIHYYNTRTQKRTTKDPRSSPKRSLDLELNLNMKHVDIDDQEQNNHESNTANEENKCKFSNAESESSLEISLDTDRKEMLAAVCMKCHMLVMMCKESPSCPNCKHVHSQSVEDKPSLEFRLLCCKD